MTLNMAWALADLMMALITLCNLTAICLLFKQVKVLLSDYMRQKKAHISDPVFKKSSMPDIADRLDCWE